MSIIESAMNTLRSRAPGAHRIGNDEQRLNLRNENSGESFAGEGCVIALDSAALRTRGLLPTESLSGRVAGEYRAIRRVVVDAAFSKSPSESCPHSGAVAISSALPGEGKTFTAFNLAYRIAVSGVPKVLLVDADLYRKQLSISLGIDKEKGFSNLLSDDSVKLASVCAKMAIPDLLVLPAGDANSVNADQFVGERIRSVLSRMAAEVPNHVVIFDTAPLLLTGETSGLIDSMSQVLIVVRAGVTLQNAVKDALAKVSTDVPAGIVFNGMKPWPGNGYEYRDKYKDYGQTP
jgi:protein-tyrosine kinase